MVLRLKPRESRSLPGLPRTEKPLETRQHNSNKSPGLREIARRGFLFLRQFCTKRANAVRQYLACAFQKRGKWNVALFALFFEARYSRAVCLVSALAMKPLIA
jgi:hypothetical protein